MKGKILAAAILAAAALGVGGTSVARQADIMSKRIDDPSKDAWSTYGKEVKASGVKSEGVPGGLAYRVRVPAKGNNPWDAAATSSIAGAIKKDDVVLLAFWARAEKPPEGAEAATIGASVGQRAAPYRGITNTPPITVGREWKMYYASGKSPIDVAPGGAGVSVHLGQAKQTIDFGPMFVLNLGPDYDLAKLPKN